MVFSSIFDIELFLQRSSLQSKIATPIEPTVKRDNRTHVIFELSFKSEFSTPNWLTVTRGVRVTKVSLGGVTPRTTVVNRPAIIGVQGSPARWIQDGDQDDKRYQTVCPDHCSVTV